MASPAQDPQARQAASQRAAQVRRERARIKQQLKQGDLQLDDVLHRAQTDPVVGRMPVAEVLAALPAHGPVKAAALLERAGIATNRRMAGLGARQRATLVEALARRDNRSRQVR